MTHRTGLARAARLLPAAVALGIALPGAAADGRSGAQLAADYGCLNCHSERSQSAPPLKRLAERAARQGGSGSDAAVQHLLEELREQGAIHTHNFVSDDAARAVLLWVAQGAK